MTKGIDCASPLTTASAKAIAAAGYSFAARYLVPEEYKWKRLTRAEAEAISGAGMQIVSVFESTASRALGGDAAGKVDAGLALNEAKLIGQPIGSAIYFAVDFDVTTAAQFDIIENYLRGITSALGTSYQVGVYGEYTIVEEMFKRKACKHFWQTYAWSKGQKSKNANIFQYKNGDMVAGVSVDLNESYGNEGWWSTVKAVEPPKLPDLGKATAVHVNVNGKKVGEGILVNGVTYVPARAVVTPLHAQILFDAKTNTVNIND